MIKQSKSEKMLRWRRQQISAMQLSKAGWNCKDCGITRQLRLKRVSWALGKKFCSRCVSEVEDEGEGSPLSEQSQGRSASLNRARGASNWISQVDRGADRPR